MTHSLRSTAARLAVNGAIALAMLLGLATGAAAQGASTLAKKSRDADQIMAAVQRVGHVRVIVLFDSPLPPADAKHDATSLGNLKASVAATRNAIIAQHFGGTPDPAPGQGFDRHFTRFEITPGFAISVTRAELEALAADPRVRSINLDRRRRPSLLQSVGLIGMPNAYVSGATGQGYAVAILDTGVQDNHELLNGKVIAQACFSNGDGKGVSLCPAGGDQQIGGNAAQPIGQCLNGMTNLCDHGTHVASIAAGLNPSPIQGRPANGVAKNASIFAVQVFTRHDKAEDCGTDPVPCVRTLESDQVRGLDHVRANLFLNDSIKVASVNMSLGGGEHRGTCDDAPQKPAIDSLRAVGVLTTISSGNDGHTAAIGSPGCISTAVTVGSTTKSDVMSSFSNYSSVVDLLAPGGSGTPGASCTFDRINDNILAGAASSPPATDGYQCMSGTSMAAPHVAGAIAAIRSACPFLLEGFNPNGAMADAIENALKSTGLPVTVPLPPLQPPPGLVRTDDVTQTRPRIRVDRAVAAACSLPLVVSHDFDGQGKSDILWRNTDGTVAIWFMDGGEVVGDAFRGPIDNSWSIVGTNDFNGDGKGDILWRNTDGTVAIWFMDGGTVIGSAFLGPIENAWTIVGTADINADQKSDIVWRKSDGTVAIWFMDGGTLMAQAFLERIDNSWSIVGTGDFNGDGRGDILWRNTDGTIAIWFMNGGTRMAQAFLGPIDNSWTIVGTGDFDGNGKSDILWRNTDGTVAIWFMDGGAIAGSAFFGPIDNSWTIVGTADFNGQGKGDILWRNADGTVAIWFMDGGTIAGSAFRGPIDNSWAIEGAAAD